MAFNGFDLSVLDKIRQTPAWKQKEQEWLDSASTSRFMKLKKKDMVSRQALNVYLDKVAIESGLGKEHVCPKMYRKTFISWLVAIYPEKHAWINSSAGHTSDIQLRHYIGTSFQRSDLEDMRSELKGWGEA